jgi:hypothetical protein
LKDSSNRSQLSSLINQTKDISLSTHNTRLLVVIISISSHITDMDIHNHSRLHLWQEDSQEVILTLMELERNIVNLLLIITTMEVGSPTPIKHLVSILRPGSSNLVDTIISRISSSSSLTQEPLGLSKQLNLVVSSHNPYQIMLFVLNHL